MKRDRYSKPFKKMVTLGESHTSGIAATRREWGWAPLVKSLIDQFQEKPVTLLNHGIGGDILSSKCPIYQEFRGRRPSGLERYEKHVIEQKPDLVIISYGYNDMRGGTPAAAFERDLNTMVGDIRKRTKAVIVLLSTYYCPEAGLRQLTGGTEDGSNWGRGGLRVQARFHQILRRAAGTHDLLYADVYDAQGGAEWMICTPSGKGDIHANDLGHRVIANKIFEVLAANCSGLSLKALKDRRRVGKSPWRYEPWKPGASCRWEDKLVRDFYPEIPAKWADRKQPRTRRG
jgi:lysophospholipase L1-like esterase